MFNLILHITTDCNYNCSYCSVIKDKKEMSLDIITKTRKFINKNQKEISSIKFFWWEPLIRFNNLKTIINKSDYEGNYSIVTNTSFLTDEIWIYFDKYFKDIFFSIDSENSFNYKEIKDFIIKYNLQDKLYFNLIVSPWKEFKAYDQFLKLYKLWFKWFNILPVYFTKKWDKNNLHNFSSIMKNILDLSIEDVGLKLYGFQENKWYDLNLINNSIFIDIDGKIYYSDIVSTYIWNKIKKELYLWNIENLFLKNFKNYSFEKEKKLIKKLENDIYTKVEWQKELHKIMDYFSIYLKNRSN